MVLYLLSEFEKTNTSSSESNQKSGIVTKSCETFLYSCDRQFVSAVSIFFTVITFDMWGTYQVCAFIFLYI